MSRDELKNLMRESVIGASMLSRKIGVSRSTVYRWLDGDAPISKMAEIAIRAVVKEIGLKL